MPKTLMAIVAAVLALGMLAPALAAEPMWGSHAHYLVIQQEEDGRLTPLFHRLVVMRAPLEGLTEESAARYMAGPDRQVRRFRSLLLGPGGEEFLAVSEAPRWIRGEFRGLDGESEMDSHLLADPNPKFVVRVPAIPGAMLDIEDADGKPLARFDLDSLARDKRISAPSPVQEMCIAPLIETGSPANRVDLLIMGDGYTSAQQSLFNSAANTLSTTMFSISPYSDYESFCNITTGFVASSQSGADHPPYNASCSWTDPSCCSDPTMQSDPLAGTFVTTAFDSRYCGWGIHRLLVLDSTKVLAAAASFPDWDRIIVVVNDSTYGGSGGYVATVSTHTAAVEVAQHEFGHSFTDLADEYEDPYPGYPACSDISGTPCEANVTNQTTRTLIKWNPWILESTPIPTPETSTYSSVVGLFQGARYLSSGMYRPRLNCAMRSLGVAFCQICKQAYILLLYNGGWGAPSAGIDPIEPGSEVPAPGPVSVPPGGTTLSVGLLQPDGGALQVTWLADGTPISGATSSSYAVGSGSESHSIQVKVTDPTALVNPDMAGTSLQSTRTWTVSSSSIAGVCGISCTATVPSSGTAGLAVSFAATSTASNCTGSVSYSWTFGDGQTSTQQNPSHTYSSPGTFTWTLTAVIQSVTCTKTGTVTITSPPVCTVTCTAASPAEGLAGEPLAFSATATATNCTGGVTFSWAFGDGATSSEQNPSHSYASAGTFSWTMTATAQGVTCTKTGTVTVTSPPGCTLACSATAPSDGLAGDPLAFTATATATDCTGAVTYSWDFGDGTTSSEQNPSHAYAAAGTYGWTLTVSVDDKTCMQSGSVIVTSPPGCTLACSAAVPAAGQTGEPLSFTGAATAANCTGAVAYSWDFGDGSSSTEQNPSHAYASEGSYNWTLTVAVDDKTCTQSGTVAVTSTPVCTLACDASAPASGIFGTPVAFTASSTATNCTGAVAYSWDFGDGSSSTEQNPSHAYSSVGTYSWSLAVTVDGLTCPKSGTIAVQSGLPGDANGDGVVSIGEVQQAINMFLGTQAVGNGVDCNGDGVVSIGEVQKVINAFLGTANSC